MSKATAYSKTGSKQAETVALDKAVFGVELNAELVKDAYNAYLSNGRSAQPTTLTRGLVRGGGKKPWRQKGTGRARVGSIRVPNWKGGGVVFGPTGLENHIVQFPIKMKRLAIRQALSAQAADGRVSVIEDFATDGKTKSAASLLAKIGATGTVLLVVDDKSDKIDQATRNLPSVTTVQSLYLNVFLIMNADDIVITKAALAQIEGWLGATTRKPQSVVRSPQEEAAEPAKDKSVSQMSTEKPVAKSASDEPAAKKAVSGKRTAKSDKKS